jgi:hypothetical protein
LKRWFSGYFTFHRNSEASRIILSLLGGLASHQRDTLPEEELSLAAPSIGMFSNPDTLERLPFVEQT